MARGKINFSKRAGATRRSGFEDTIETFLKEQKVDYKYEPYPLKYLREAEYTFDFLLPNGIIIEAKGFFLRDDQVKMRAVRKSHPHLDIRMVFENAYGAIQGATVRNDGTKMSCREWCEKNGFQWAHKGIPESWLYEKPQTVTKAEL